MDCNPPSSSVHGIFQARTPEQIVISYSRRSSQPRDWTHPCLLCLLHWQAASLTILRTKKALFEIGAGSWFTVWTQRWGSQSSQPEPWYSSGEEAEEICRSTDRTNGFIETPATTEWRGSTEFNFSELSQPLTVSVTRYLLCIRALDRSTKQPCRTILPWNQWARQSWWKHSWIVKGEHSRRLKMDFCSPLHQKC